MECKTVRDHILNLDEENDPIRDPEVARHLAGCADCQTLLEGIDRTWKALSAHPGLEPSPGFNQSVWRKIEAAERQQPLRWLQLAFLPPPVRILAWSSAAVLAGALGLLLLLPPAPEPTPVRFSASDQRDQQLLMELDELMDFDESRVMDVYEEWDITQEIRPEDSGDAKTPAEQEPAGEAPGKVMLSRDPLHSFKI
jgi:hypothetical protein